MYLKKWKKQKIKGMRIAAGILTVALTVAAPFEGVPEQVFGAQWDTTVQALPSGGLIEAVTLQVTPVASGVTAGANELRSIRPQLRQYDWDCYSNDYYYSKLSTKEQQLYERLDAACGELLTSSSADAESYNIKGGGTCYGTKTVSCLGLSQEQVKKVHTIFLYANPQYYFLNGNLLMPNGDSCAIRLYDAFADGSKRATSTQKVRAQLEALQAQVSDSDLVYETEAQIHDLLCNKLTYMSGEEVLADPSDPYYTQTIYGALMSGETVCAGYTKLFSMLCNYFGIDCIAVTSADHAWNEVRYGDHWYIVDVTWDDTRDRSKFFHITDQRMTATDQNRSHVMNTYYEGIRPVADTEFSESLKALGGLSQPQVEIKDTAPGVTITMTSDEGDIYYTLDGTAPGADDRYTQPIELTDGGTYIVTAVTMGEGVLPSAYEIFPVRIAGGSVSIAAAANISGKKIKVKYKASKSYTGYEISYASKKDFSNQKSAKVTGKSVTISGLKKGKTYYIRVRGYKKDVYGNYYYTPYSKMKKVTVTK